MNRKTLLETNRLFQEKDFNLAIRRMSDHVLELDEIPCYEQLIQFYEVHLESVENSISHWEVLMQLLNEKANQEDYAAQPILTTELLGKQFKKNGFHLENVSLSINEGEIIGLVGENGNGKTTVLSILAKELQQETGKITYHRLDENAMSSYDLKSNLVFIPQRTLSWNGKLKTNLKLAASHHGILGKRNELVVLTYCIRFGLWKFRDFNWTELSSGYKMRFELVRAMLRNPQLLLLDEPLANLDILAQQVVLEDLKILSERTRKPLGIALSSQQLFEVEKFASKVLFLRDGKPLDASNSAEDGKTIIEIDIKCSKKELSELLRDFHLQNIEENAGCFLITILEEKSFKKVLKAISESDKDIIVIRDISNSSRRFFVA